MEQSTAEKIGWGIIKWTIGIVVTLGILGGIFWAVFYSVGLANNPLIIPLRVWYENTYNKYTGFYAYPIQVATDSGTTYYSIWGTFSRIDVTQGLIYIKATDQNVYAFAYGPNINQLDNGYLLTDAQVGQSVGSYELPGSVNYKISADGNPYTDKSLFFIQWDDMRTLRQIESDYQNNTSVPLNAGSSVSVAISKYN